MASDSFLENPTPDLDEQINRGFNHYTETLAPAARMIATAARAHLAGDEAVMSYLGNNKKLVLQLQNFTWQKPNGMPQSGTVKITLRLRFNTIGSAAVVRYLHALRDFQGAAEHLAEQITQALFWVLKPDKINVQIVEVSDGLRRTAEGELERSGFED